MMLMDPHVKDPDAAFIAMMHDYVQTFAGKAASTEDFESTVNKHMTPAMDVDHNHKMDWFFDEYVYGTGVPVYTLSYQIADAGNGRWRVDGTLDRTGVSAEWKDIVPLYVKGGKVEDRLGWIHATKPKNHFLLHASRRAQLSERQ